MNEIFEKLKAMTKKGRKSMQKEYLVNGKKVQAIQWNGKNRAEIEEFAPVNAVFYTGKLLLRTPKVTNREVPVNVGDYVVKDGNGDFYFYKESEVKICPKDNVYMNHYREQCESHKNMIFADYGVWVGGETWSEMEIRFNFSGSKETVDFKFSDRKNREKYAEYFVVSSLPVFDKGGYVERLELEVRKPRYEEVPYKDVLDMCSDEKNPYYKQYQDKAENSSPLHIAIIALNNMWFLPKDGKSLNAKITAFSPNTVRIDGKEMKFEEFARTYLFLENGGNIARKKLIKEKV